MPAKRTVSDEERAERKGSFGTCVRCGATHMWRVWAQPEFGQPYQMLCGICRKRKWTLLRYGIDIDNVKPAGKCDLCRDAKAISPHTSMTGPIYFLCRRCMTAMKCMKGDPKLTTRLTQAARGTMRGGYRETEAKGAGSPVSRPEGLVVGPNGPDDA